MFWDAATEAVLNYSENPSTFDPEKLGLFGYLKMSANRDLLNALDKEKRRRTSESSAASRVVELGPGGGKELERDEDIERIENRSQQDEERSREVMAKVYEALPDPKDRRMLELILDGVRETEPYAEILSIRDRDEAEQRHIVKQNKDRIKARIRRLRKQLYG